MRETFKNTDMPLWSNFILNNDGDYNMAVDGSIVPVSYYLKPEEQVIPNRPCIYLARMHILVKCTGKIDADKYGDFLTALPNGIEVKLNRKDGGSYTVTRSCPIQTNTDWAKYCYKTEILEWGNGDQYLNCIWDLTAYGDHLKINQGDNIEFVIRDDLSSLQGQCIHVQGVY